MGTVVQISLYDPGRSRADKKEAIRRAFRAIEGMERVASRQKATSELSRLNRKSGGAAVPVSPTLFHILRQSLRVARESGGAFDPTVGPLLELWGFGGDSLRLPSAKAIRSVLPLVDFHKVLLDSPTVRLAIPGMRLDLGGIAKGTAIDRAMDTLLSLGFRDVMIDAGGDLGIHSSGATRGRIRVWIRHPRKSGAFFAYFCQDSGAVATSGDYEQFFVQEGKRYHHLLNPVTGYPDSDLISVTVVAPRAELADAMATAAFVMGWNRARKFAAQQPNFQFLLVRQEGDSLIYWATTKLAEKLHIVDRTVPPSR